MHVFVTGGTGAVGRRAVDALVEAGHAVTAVARSTDAAARLRRQGATPVRISIFDRPALVSAMAGHDAAINLATAIPPVSRFLLQRAWTANDRIRHEGSAVLTAAAVDAGVPRFVQESVAMLYVDQAARWIHEGDPTDTYPMARGNHAAETATRRFGDAGGIGVVLRFGWFHGPGATHSEQLLRLARAHIATQIGAPGGFVSSVHVADAGRAVASALDMPAGTYNVADDTPLTRRQYADALARAAGRTPWIRPPGRIAHLFGDRLTSLTRSLRVSNRKLRQISDWTPHYPSAREGLQATARHILTPV